MSSSISNSSRSNLLSLSSDQEIQPHQVDTLFHQFRSILGLSTNDPQQLCTHLKTIIQRQNNPPNQHTQHILHQFQDIKITHSNIKQFYTLLLEKLQNNQTNNHQTSHSNKINRHLNNYPPKPPKEKHTPKTNQWEQIQIRNKAIQQKVGMLTEQLRKIKEEVHLISHPPKVTHQVPQSYILNSQGNWVLQTHCFDSIGTILSVEDQEDLPVISALDIQNEQLPHRQQMSNTSINNAQINNNLSVNRKKTLQAEPKKQKQNLRNQMILQAKRIKDQVALITNAKSIEEINHKYHPEIKPSNCHESQHSSIEPTCFVSQQTYQSNSIINVHYQQQYQNQNNIKQINLEKIKNQQLIQNHQSNQHSPRTDSIIEDIKEITEDKIDNIIDDKTGNKKEKKTENKREHIIENKTDNIKVDQTETKTNHIIYDTTDNKIDTKTDNKKDNKIDNKTDHIKDHKTGNKTQNKTEIEDKTEKGTINGRLSITSNKGVKIESKSDFHVGSLLENIKSVNSQEQIDRDIRQQRQIYMKIESLLQNLRKINCKYSTNNDNNGQIIRQSEPIAKSNNFMASSTGVNTNQVSSFIVSPCFPKQLFQSNNNNHQSNHISFNNPFKSHPNLQRIIQNRKTSQQKIKQSINIPCFNKNQYLNNHIGQQIQRNSRQKSLEQRSCVRQQIMYNRKVPLSPTAQINRQEFLSPPRLSCNQFIHRNSRKNSIIVYQRYLPPSRDGYDSRFVEYLKLKDQKVQKSQITPYRRDSSISTKGIQLSHNFSPIRRF